MTGSSTSIERLVEFPLDFGPRYRAPRHPVIVTGQVAHWPALAWTPRSLDAQFGSVETQASVQLPESGVVYLRTDNAHRCSMKFCDFVELMESGACCYIDQADLGQFPGLADGCPIDELLPPGRHIVNLWIGARTRSGLHYDPMDNYLIQLYGEKSVILAAPGDRRGLYPFTDNLAKSQIDPEIPDLSRFPRTQSVTFFTGNLQPGDLLYIPRGWWHFLRAPDQSISVNLWHEPALTVADELGAIAALGPAGWARVTRDFLWHGVLQRPFERRLYSPPPTGKQLYDLCAAMFSTRSVP